MAKKRNHLREHLGGMHHDSMMGNQPECTHCDPWSNDYIDMRSDAEKGPVKDEWTEAWIKNQEQK